MSETNKGGGNTPKPGEQGFQKSTAGKKVPTASPLKKGKEKTLIVQEELSILPTPAYLTEDVLILGTATTSFTKGKILPGSPISNKDINRSVRDVLIAQYADLRDKAIVDARIRYSLPDTKKIMESRGYDAFFIARVKEDQLEYDITQADRAFKTNLLKVNKEYRTPWFKKSTICQDCGKRDENISQHSCRDIFS